MPSFFLEYIKRINLAKRRKRRHRKRKLESEFSEFPKEKSKFSELPKEVIQLIASKLPLTDHISASKVCKSWNAALSEDVSCWQGIGFPCLFASNEIWEFTRTCISILDNGVLKLHWPEAYLLYCWGSYREWLIMVDPVGILKIKFWSPFTGKQITLPPISGTYHKIVVSGPPFKDDFICMLLTLHRKDRELAFYMQGAQSWLKYRLTGEPFEDAVFFNGSFYLLDGNCNIWQIGAEGICSSISEGGLSELKMQLHVINMLDRPQIDESPSDKILRYLVQSCGEIFLVCRYLHGYMKLETIKFEVYSLDLFLSSWKKGEDLKDHMLFLGKSCSSSLSAKELGVGISNSIYFTDDRDQPWDRDKEWYVNELNEWEQVLPSFKYLLGSDGTAKKNADGIWGNFKLRNDDGNSFSFSGDLDKWPYTWFIAPIWWYCKNITHIKSRF